MRVFRIVVIVIIIIIKSALVDSQCPDGTRVRFALSLHADNDNDLALSPAAAAAASPPLERLITREITCNPCRGSIGAIDPSTVVITSARP